MKRCPECMRDYYDDTLSFCLEDGSSLVSGVPDEPTTVIFPGTPEPSQENILRPDPNPGQSRTSLRGLARVAFKKRSVVAGVLGIILIGLLGAGGYLFNNEIPTRPIDSIAVMPFVNGSGDPSLDYLSDGMTEMLISSLSSLPNLNVKPRSTVFRHKESDPRSIGNELDVDSVLSGRIVQRGETISLFIELVYIPSDRVIWSQQYARKESDIAALQSAIARDVSGKLRAQLSIEEEQKIRKEYTSDPNAFRLFLRGRHEWNKFTLDGLTRSITFFESAIQADPDFALAYSGLADSYVLLGVDFASPRDTMPKAKLAALHAISLDDSLAEAHSSLGSYKLFFEWDTPGAENAYRKALALDPGNASVRHFFSHCLQFSGRESEALSEMKTAVELEPLSALNNAELGWAYYLAEQYEASIEQSNKTLELDPGFSYAYFVLGLAYNAKGSYADARAAIGKGLTLAPDWLELQGLLAYAHASEGDIETAREILSKALKAAEGGYMNEVLVASVYTAMGENEDAIAWLEKGYQARCSWMKWIAIEPSLVKLRPDRRFRDLVRRIGN